VGILGEGISGAAGVTAVVFFLATVGGV
jgi:hypothetical protein